MGLPLSSRRARRAGSGVSWRRGVVLDRQDDERAVPEHLLHVGAPPSSGGRLDEWPAFVRVGDDSCDRRHIGDDDDCLRWTTTCGSAAMLWIQSRVRSALGIPEMNSCPNSWCRKISIRRGWPDLRPVVVRSMTWLWCSEARTASLEALSSSIAHSCRLNWAARQRTTLRPVSNETPPCLAVVPARERRRRPNAHGACPAHTSTWSRPPSSCRRRSRSPASLRRPGSRPRP